jgi:hypothetical protein
MSEAQETREKFRAARWWVVGLAASVTAGAALYRGLKWGGYGNSAAMFLGIPLVLTIVLASTPRAKTLTGGILKGITFALLIVAPEVPEDRVSATAGGDWRGVGGRGCENDPFFRGGGGSSGRPGDAGGGARAWVCEV